VAGFGRWWAGTAVSALGSFIGALALSFTLVRTLHASATAVAALGVVQLLAGIVAAPVAGVIVDRTRRRRTMVVADLVRAVAVGVLPLAHHLGHLSLALCGLSAAVTGMANVVFLSAARSHLPQLLGRELLVGGIATLAVTISLCEIVGFASAGWLVHAFGPPDAMLLDAASFVASAAFVLSIAAPERDRSRPADAPDVVTSAGARSRSEIRDASAGLRMIAGEPVLRSLALASVGYDVAASMGGVAYLLYLSREVGFGDGLLGSVFAVGGLTSLLGARWATRAERAGRIGRAYAASGVARSIGMAAMPAASSTGGVGVGLLVANQVLTDPVWMLQEVAESSVRQARTPDDIAGRVHAGHHLLGNAGRLGGTVLAGVIAQVAGPRTALWTACAMAFVVSVWAWGAPIGRVRRAAADE
jgi:predicted MFS family arabinose efflux permease